jgi:3-oxoacyl-[acyl-carrier protein] reductase
MGNDFNNQQILITGASGGIGKAVAEVLAQQGARCILSGRDQNSLQKVAASLAREAYVAPYDLHGFDEIGSWMKNLAQQYGKLDGLVHSAGLHCAKPLRMLDVDSVNQMMQVNVSAAIALAKGFRQKNVVNESGSIVLLSSVVGLVGQPGLSAYAASKGAIIALTKSLAVELAREKIRVNCVVPAVVRTPMTEKLFGMLSAEQIQSIEAQHLLGLGEPVDVANAIAFLLSGAARWITGSHLLVDGGYTAR